MGDQPGSGYFLQRGACWEEPGYEVDTESGNFPIPFAAVCGIIALFQYLASLSYTIGEDRIRK